MPAVDDSIVRAIKAGAACVVAVGCTVRAKGKDNRHMDTTNLTLIAFDPGGTTGIALKIAGRYTTTTATEPNDLWPFFDMQYDAVIYETFATQLISKYGLLTVRIVGGIEALATHLGYPLYPQPPQRRRAFLQAAEQVLQETARNYVIHQVDALAHLMAWEYHARKDSGLVVPMKRKATS